MAAPRLHIEGATSAGRVKSTGRDLGDGFSHLSENGGGWPTHRGERAGAAGEPKATFSDLVEQAFIEPIRSVLIIDDQYPTWEQIFGEEGYDASDKARWTPKSKILKVIKQFRKMSPALTVDIHDGQHDEEIGNYLHQSDLLVLDYQLEKREPYGALASQMIADLLNNNQFNLVIIHTAIGDQVDTFNTVLMSLLTPLKIKDARVAEGLELIETLEDTGEERFANILGELQVALNATAYVALQEYERNGGKRADFMKSSAKLATFRDLAEKAGWNVGEELKVLDWGMSSHNTKVASYEAAPRDPKSTYTGSEVNSNTLIFLKVNDAIETYSVYPRGGEFGSPVWRLFMAADFGKFEIDEDRTAQLKVSYLSGKGNKMQVEPVEARLVGQLRYEYALNLIQKLGVEFTRIGLDFSAPTE